MKRIQEGLLDLFQAPEGYEVLLGIGGATAFGTLLHSVLSGNVHSTSHAESSLLNSLPLRKKPLG